jgi:uncharacterized protein (TIGR03083 family)
MDTAECYRAVRARMIELAGGLSEEQLTTPVPACPAWTVRETYAHLAGLCTEVLDGAQAGRATDADTARQVAERAGRGIARLCAEWAERGPEMDARLAGEKGYRYNLMAFDVWNHEQDVRNALGIPQARKDQTTEVVSAMITDMFARGWRKARLAPAVRLVTPTDDAVVGVGEPVATLETSEFDLVRMLSGRRTHEEMAAMGWIGEPADLIERLHLFTPPVQALGE